MQGMHQTFAEHLDPLEGPRPWKSLHWRNVMKNQRLLLSITVFNILLLVFSLRQARAVVTDGIAPVLRGRALEIVDDRGRVRASIAILPADPHVKMPDGTSGYPETVLLRLIDSKGGPNVKLGATERGAELGGSN